MAHSILAFLFAGLLIASATVPVVHAQEAERRATPYYWVSGGFGFSSLGYISASAHASVQYRFALASLRLTANSGAEAEGFLGPVGDELFDQGLLVGLCRQGPKRRASLAGGIARVSGSRYEPDGGFFGMGRREDISPVLGVPVEGQLFTNLSRHVGIGLYLFANVNEEKSFGGATLNLQVGGLQ